MIQNKRHSVRLSLKAICKFVQLRTTEALCSVIVGPMPTPHAGQRTLHFGHAKKANRNRPLIVVVQSAEEVNSCVLRDLLGLLLLVGANM